MPAGDYVIGLLLWAGIWGSAGYLATIAVRRLLSTELVPRVLAWATIFLSALLAAHLVAGALTILHPVSVLIVSVLIALAGWRLIPHRVDGAPRSGLPDVRHDVLGLSLAGGALLAVATLTIAALIGLSGLAPGHIDARSFGLPLVAEWIRTGSIWDPGAFLPLFQVRTYPNNGDLFYLATVLPWDNDAFLRLTSVPLLALTGLATYATARELRAPMSTAALVAATLLATRVVSFPAVDQIKPDIFMYATFSTGLFFLVRHTRTSDRWDLLLAGAGLGLAAGSRWYGVSSAVVVFGVWVVGRYLARCERPRLLRDGAVLAAASVATGGFWLLRNAVLTGNPLYPVKAEIGGLTLLGAPRDIVTEKLGYTIVDRLGQGTAWTDYILPDYRDAFGLPGALFLAMVVVATVLAFRRGLRRPAWVPLGLLVVTLGLALSYAITPASAQGLAPAPLPGLVGGNSRWLVPALLAAAPVGAWAVGRLPARARDVAHVILFAGVIAGLRTTWDVPGKDIVLSAVALVALCAVVFAIVRWLATAGQEGRTRRVVALALVVLMSGAVAGQAVQARYNDDRYRAESPVLDWLNQNASGGNRIGMAGDWPVGTALTYPAFGKRLGNDVRYVGPVVRGQLRQYHDGGAFTRALRRGHYDLLAVGRQPELDPETLQAQLDSPPGVLEMPEEAAWATAAGYTEVVRDGAFILLRAPEGR